MNDYRKLKVWEKAHECTLIVYNITNQFPGHEKFSLTNQLRRATVSIPTNIAEGCGKFTSRDFANYLQTTLGSTHEVQYLIFLSLELKYLEQHQYDKIYLLLNEVKPMLISLLKNVRKTIDP